MTGDLISTVEELDALPVGSVVLDRHGFPWHKGSGSWVTTRDGGVIEPHKVAPLTLLYRPDRPTLSDAALIEEAARRGLTVHDAEIKTVTNGGEDELRAKIARQVRDHCTVPTEVAISRNTDLTVLAVADWIENTPEWVTP